MIYGLDLLGIAKYPNRARRFFPKGFALGAFSNAFGDAIPAVRGVLDTGNCVRVRIHLAWKDRHDFSKLDFLSISKEAKRWVPVVKAYPAIDWQFSGACENLLGKGDAAALAVLVQGILPGTYVQSGKSLLQGERIINECHGNLAVPPEDGQFNYSFDGNTPTRHDVRAQLEGFSGATTFFLWASRFNGKTSDTDATKRERRTAWPDGEYVKHFLEMLRG